MTAERASGQTSLFGLLGGGGPVAGGKPRVQDYPSTEPWDVRETLAREKATLGFYVSGYGFPLYRGGPMHYAKEVGVVNVLAAMQRFADMNADNRQAGAWQPAQGLVAG